mmetsp:Transcript_5851/g.18783  ORF Transcript_5851/g.18783 Transcript_5851/m.18783 type:complete len:212 (+) Transcript_5851:977-1612(+)
MTLMTSQALSTTTMMTSTLAARATVDRNWRTTMTRARATSSSNCGNSNCRRKAERRNLLTVTVATFQRRTRTKKKRRATQMMRRRWSAWAPATARHPASPHAVTNLQRHPQPPAVKIAMLTKPKRRTNLAQPKPACSIALMTTRPQALKTSSQSSARCRSPARGSPRTTSTSQTCARSSYRQFPKALESCNAISSATSPARQSCSPSTKCT